MLTISPLLACDRHPATGREAMVRDEGESAWLYLTDADGREVVADCWLFNTVPAPAGLGTFGAFADRDRPPPATARFAGPGAQRALPEPETLAIAWAPDGQGACVRLDGEIIGFIDARARRGFSRHLLACGPWGEPFDATAYATLFE